MQILQELLPLPIETGIQILENEMIPLDRDFVSRLWIPAGLVYLGSALIDYLLSAFVLIGLIIIVLIARCFYGYDELDEWADW